MRPIRATAAPTLALLLALPLLPGAALAYPGGVPAASPVPAGLEAACTAARASRRAPRVRFAALPCGRGSAVRYAGRASARG